MSRYLVPLVIVAFSMSACLFDPDDPCGDNQTLDQGQCVCSATAILDAAGDCAACGDNEVAEAGACVCKEDFVRLVAGGPCEPPPTTNPCGDNEVFSEGSCVCVDGFLRTTTAGPCVPLPGDECTDADTCPTPWECFVFDSGSGDGYCTNFDCSTSDDCHDGFACDTEATPTVCIRPPVGQGEACQVEGDCAEFEADYCDAFMTHMCLVQDCTLEPSDCFEGWVCCDMSFVPVTLPNLCLPPENCPN